MSRLLRIDNTLLLNASLGMHAGQSFEWTFVVPGITGPDDKRIDALYERSDSLVESHSGLNLVTMLASGSTATEAGLAAVATLEQCGLHSQRSYPDLVTRTDIAERTGKERQAVDHWIRGNRRKDFPAPVHLAARGLWLWRDVAEWLERENVEHDADEGVAYPSLADHVFIDNQIRKRSIWSAKFAVYVTRSTTTASLKGIEIQPRRGLVGAGR